MIFVVTFGCGIGDWDGLGLGIWIGNRDWELGIGIWDWGLGLWIGDWGLVVMIGYDFWL